MMVYHVVQIVSPGHNTSYRTGRNWIESHDSESQASTRAELFNYHRSHQCIGVEYMAEGPHDESIEFS